MIVYRISNYSIVIVPDSGVDEQLVPHSVEMLPSSILHWTCLDLRLGSHLGNLFFLERNKTENEKIHGRLLKIKLPPNRS